MGEQKRKKLAEPPHGTAPRYDKGRRRGMRMTVRGVVLFLLAMLILDILLFAVFKFGFDRCYGLLCLLE